jgi:ankyrin repeat protein
MNVLLIFPMLLAFTSASTNSFSVTKKKEYGAKIPSLYEMILTSVMEKLPVTSDYSAIQLVLELQVRVPSLPDGSNILHFASKTRKVDLMRVSINSGRFDVNEVDKNGFTALHHVCNGTENPEMAVDAAKLLVANGANINALDYWNNSPLYFTVKGSNFELLEYFLSVGAQTEFQDSILEFAIERCTDSRITKVLTEFNPRLIESAKKFLLLASERRMIDLMRDAIDSGKFDVNAVIRGSTALHRVCIGRQNPEMAVDAAKLLVANGANINALSAQNFTPLYYAIQKSNRELVEYLKSEGGQFFI